jgi:hypothetical protein
MKIKLRIVFVCALLSVLLFACKNQEKNTNGKQEEPEVEISPDKPIEDMQAHEDALQDELKAMEKEIIQEARAIEESASCDDDFPCVSIAFGAKPCGGPWKYLVLPMTDKTGKLMEKVTAYNAFEDELNKTFNRQSDCLFVEEPEVECKLGRCQKVK